MIYHKGTDKYDNQGPVQKENAKNIGHDGPTSKMLAFGQFYVSTYKVTTVPFFPVLLRHWDFI